MTLYPKINNIRNSHLVIKIMLGISILISLTCIIINICIPGNFFWAFLVIAGIVYTWVTVMYSIKRNINIASNVFVQCLLVSLLILAIDYFIGYSGWSINIAIPIVIMVANSTLMVLTIVSRKRYMRYALYHMLTFLFSMIQLILLFCGVLENKVLTIVASGIAGLSLLLTVILCGKAMWEETKKRLHM